MTVPSTRLVQATAAERRRLAGEIADAELSVEAAKRRLADLRAYDLRLAALVEPPTLEPEDRTDDDDDLDLATEVADRLGAPGVIFGRSRQREVQAQRVAVWQALRDLGWSYPRIGRVFGRDHSTIQFGVKSANGGTP